MIRSAVSQQMRQSSISKGSQYVLDRTYKRWYLYNVEHVYLQSPQYTITYTHKDVLESFLVGLNPWKSRHVALLPLPFCTRPAWPSVLETPLHLLFWLCGQCGRPLSDGIGRVALLFGIGYVNRGIRIKWQVTLIGCCCLQHMDMVCGTSYTDDVLQLYKTLRDPIAHAMHLTSQDWPCVCSRPARLCNTQECRDTRRLIHLMKRQGNSEYDPLTEHLEICIDLWCTLGIDLITPIRYARCHNLDCHQPLPNNRKQGGFLCPNDCRRVVYCSARCRNKLKKTHQSLGCQPYTHALQSKHLIYSQAL